MKKGITIKELGLNSLFNAITCILWTFQLVDHFFPYNSVSFYFTAIAVILYPISIFVCLFISISQYVEEKPFVDYYVRYIFFTLMLMLIYFTLAMSLVVVFISFMQYLAIIYACFLIMLVLIRNRLNPIKFYLIWFGNNGVFFICIAILSFGV